MLLFFHLEIYPAGCACFNAISRNVAMEESSIEEDHERGDEQTFSEVCNYTSTGRCNTMANRGLIDTSL